MKNQAIKIVSGFTLIELLVVVLIIGILAAVAVPQYQLSIHKTRVTRILPLISSLRKAEQLYYLNNSRYTYKLSELDLTIVGDAESGGMIHDDFHLNMNDKRFILSYCPHAGVVNGSANCLENRWLYYTEYFDNSTPRACGAPKQQVKKLCQILLNS